MNTTIRLVSHARVVPSLLRVLAILPVVALMLLVPSSFACGEDQFRPMFTDEAMTGWVRTNTPSDTWRFEDGVLYCTGKPIGEIRTAKMYQNFVLELEWRHMVPRGNAGIFVWADDITSRGVPFHRGIEVQVLENAYGNNRSHTTHGDIFPIHGATMTPINGRGGSRAFPTENRSKPSPQWNHYRIECRDGEVSLAVNGKVVTRGKDCVPRKGYLCLESEGGVVEYRNLKIMELPGGDVAPEHVAIADRGYQSLYSGLDLRGLSTDHPEHWKVNDWVLSYVGGESVTGQLQTEAPRQDASFVVDLRLKDDSSTAVIRTAPDVHIDLKDDSIVEHLESAGRWNRIEVINRGGTRRVEVNGTVVDVQKAPSQVSGLLLAPTGAVDFANLYGTGRDVAGN